MLRVRPPGIEWKTGHCPKMGNGPRPEMGKKWPQNGEKQRKMTPNPIFSPFWGHFFPISGRGPFSIFRPIFSHFRISTPGGLTRNRLGGCGHRDVPSGGIRAAAAVAASDDAVLRLIAGDWEQLAEAHRNIGSNASTCTNPPLLGCSERRNRGIPKNLLRLFP